MMLKKPPSGGPDKTTDHVTEWSTAMHQRGHDYYGTECPVHCDKAAKWAARRLITPRQFLNAARTSRGLEDMADILAVLPADVFNYMADMNPDEWSIMVRLTGLTGASKE